MNSVSWNLAVDRVVHFPQVIVGIGFIVAGAVLMAALRPHLGETSVAALALSGGGAIFLIVKTVRAARMSTTLAEGHLVVRDLWSSRSIAVSRVHSLRAVEYSGADVVELRLEAPSESIVVLSWPPQRILELDQLIRSAGGAPETTMDYRYSELSPSGTGSTQPEDSSHVAPGAGFRLGDLGWQREVYRSEHALERTAVVCFGLLGVGLWWATRSPAVLALVAIAAACLIALNRRSQRVSVCVENGELCVRNMWTTHRVGLEGPMRLEVVGGRGSLLVSVSSAIVDVVVEAAPWGDPNGLARLIEAAGGRVEIMYDPGLDPPSDDLVVAPYWRRLWRVY